MTRKSKGGKRSAARKSTTRLRSRRAAAPRTDRLTELVAASAKELALPIDAAWRASVKLNLKLLFEHAALVDALSLSDEVEPAPVFRA
jgi:hypothetical protein